MSNERMQSALEDWFAATDPQPPDARQTATRLATRVARTRQRGRWLPLVRFRRNTPTPIALDTTDAHLEAMPATNGRAPTSIGRTQTMLSPAKAITAGALVFAIGGVMLVAQPFQQPSGAPGAVIPEPPVAVTGSVTGGDCPVPETIEVADGLTTSRDGYCNTIWTLDDARFDGTVTWAANYDHRPDRSGVEVGTYGVSVADDSGAWRMVPEVLFQTPAGPYPTDPLPRQFVMLGEGAYEGYYAVFNFDGWNGNTGTLDGFVIQGELPPVPDATSGS